MDTILKAFEKIQELIKILIGFVLILIICIILLQTFTRYVIFYSLPWSEELSRYLFTFLIMIGFNIGISENMTVRIDLIDGFLKGKVKTVIEFFRQIIALVVSCFFVYSTFDMIKIGAFQKSPAMRIPMQFIYIMMAIGFALAVISIITVLIKMCKKTMEMKPE